MKITFAQQHVVLASDLDLGSVLGIEEHTICRLDRPDIGSYGDDLTPSEPSSDRHRCRDHDPTAAAPFTGLIVGRDQHSIMQHPDRQRTLVQAAGVLGAALVAQQSVTAPASRDGADDQQESDNACHGRSNHRYSIGAKIATGIEDLGFGVLQFRVGEMLHISDLALFDPVGMHLVDERLD